MYKKDDNYLKKELYELIKKDESIFDFIQLSSLDGLWYWDIENPENEWMNARFWETLGYNPEEMPHLSSAWQSIINPDDLQLALENFNKHVENPNYPYDQIVRYTHKNGSIVWIRCRGMAIRDANGKVIRMLGAHHDITEIKKNELELLHLQEKASDNEEKYKALFLNAPLSYQSLNEEGCFLDVNPKWLQTLGYEREEVIGSWFGSFLHPDYVEHFKINFPAFKKRGYVSNVQFKMHKKDGSYIYVSFEGCVGYNPDGKFRQTYCVFKDITTQKENEESLIEEKIKAEKSETLLNITGEIAKLGGWEIDLEKQTLTWTKEVYIIHELDNSFIPTVEQAINFYDDVSKPIIQKAVNDAILNGKPFDVELGIITAKGNYKDIRALGNIKKNINGTVAFVYGAFQDITVQKQLKNDLILAKERAEKSEYDIQIKNEEYESINEELNQSNYQLIIAKERAEKSEERLRLMLKNSNDAFVLINDKGEQIFISDASERDTGFTINELKGPIQNVIYPPDLDDVLKAWEKVLNTKNEVIRTQYRHKHKHKEYIWYEAAAQNYFDNPAINAALVNVRDITIIKETEASLIKAKVKAEENEAKYSKMVDILPDGVIIHQNGKIVYANNTAAKIMKAKSTESMIGSSAIEFVHPDYRQKAIERIRESMINQTIASPIEEIFIDLESHSINVYVTAIPFVYNGINSMLTVFTDITNIKETEKELIAEKDKAEENQIILKYQNREIELQNERLESLLKISQYQTNSIQDLLDFALEEAIKLTSSKIGYIYFYNESNQQFVLNTWSKEVMKECHVMEPKTIYDLSKTGIWGEAVRHRKPILINDFEVFNPLKKGNPEGHVKLNKFLTIPVIIDNEIVAVAGVANKETNYNNSDIRQLTLLMDSVWKMSERITLIENLKIEKEKALESEEKHKFLFENTIQGVVYHDFNGEIIYANKAAERILGLSIEQLKGLTSLDPRWKTIQEKGINFPGELHPAMVTLKTGKPVINAKMGVFNPEKNDYKWININSLPKFRNNETTPYQVAVTFEDITERKQNEELLKISAEKWESTFNSITDIITVISKDHEFIEINKAGCDSLGMKRKDIIGKKCYDLVHNIHNPINGCPCIRSLSTNEMGFNEVFDNGRYYLVTVWPIHNQENEIIAFSHSAKDITDKKIAELELIKYKEHLEELVKERTLELVIAKQIAESATKAKSEFLANMSHEIRTPMNAIMGFSELLSNSIKEEQQKTQAQSIHRSALNLLDIINDILDLSKIEAGKITINNTKVNLQHFFEDIKTLFEVQVQQKGLDFHIENENEMPKSALIDDVRLRQVLINLIGNAVKFTEKGHIILTLNKKINATENNKIDLIINVEDTGIGIPEDQQQIIFEPFNQHEKHNSQKYGGTGLGLSISKKLIELMGGNIHLTSKPNKGSNFEIYIKGIEIFDEDVISSNNDLYDLKTTVFESANVIVCDDNKTNRLLIAHLLQNSNLTIHEAKNGLEALELANKINPDIILMDLRMPEMNGYEATTILKMNDNTKHIPVIAISASVNIVEKKENYINLFNDFILKPFKIEKLIKVLKKYIKVKA